METKRALEDAARLIARDQMHCWHPYTQAATAPLPLPVVRASGAEIDLADGTVVIDATASWWVNLHGHGNQALLSAITEQIERLGHVMFADLTHEPAVMLAERLSQLLPGNPQRFFYSDNGSTAVETALKMAIQYWYNKGERQRRRVIALRHGYHGETLGAMAVSCRTLFRGPFEPYLFEVEWIDPPAIGDFDRSLDQLQALLERGDCAAFIFEPWVQAVGGMRSHDLVGLDQLLQLCRQYHVLTIADEVFTGCGRLGPYFACDRLTEKPDMICLAKALTGGIVPFGVTACSEWIYEAFLSEERGRAFLHGHSYCGNPVGCAAAVASLSLLQSHESTNRRGAIARSHRRFLDRWEGDSRLSRIEAIGTLLVVEYRTEGGGGYYNGIRDSLSQWFLDRNIVMRPFGNTIHVLPPYCISESQLDKIYTAIEESVDVIGTTTAAGAR